MGVLNWVADEKSEEAEPEAGELQAEEEEQQKEQEEDRESGEIDDDDELVVDDKEEGEMNDDGVAATRVEVIAEDKPEKDPLLEPAYGCEIFLGGLARDSTEADIWDFIKDVVRRELL